MLKRAWLRREHVKAIAMGLAATGAAGVGTFAYATQVEPGWLDVRKVTLRLPRLSPHFNGYRIVQISDFHVGEWISEQDLEDVIRLVNAQEPDLIAITGDFVTRTYEGADADLVPFLGALHARDGAVAVLGNHDYWGKPGPGIIGSALRESGVIDLNNRVHTLERDGAAFHIAGIDSVREGQDRLDKVLSALPGDGAAMLLAHEPDFADVSAPTGRFDLQISGHSHGGQIVLPFVGPPHLPPMGRKYHTGLYKVGSMLQYTTRGVGVVGLPVRFLCRPEITVLTLERTG